MPFYFADGAPFARYIVGTARMSARIGRRARLMSPITATHRRRLGPATPYADTPLSINALTLRDK